MWPLLNLYGSLSLFAAMSVAIFIGFAFRYKLWFAGGFVLALAAIFLAYGVTWNEGTMPPVPSLQSYWAKIHVPIVVSSYAAFLVSFVFSCVYLLKYYAQRAVRTRARETQRRAPAPVARWLAALPSLPQLDVIVYRAVAIGLPLISIGIITGAMWAKEAWGAYWQWDPKETAALFSWIIYLAYMHLHTRHAWRGLRTNWVSVIGFVSIIFCYLGVNIWISASTATRFERRRGRRSEFRPGTPARGQAYTRGKWCCTRRAKLPGERTCPIRTPTPRKPLDAR